MAKVVIDCHIYKRFMVGGSGLAGCSLGATALESGQGVFGVVLLHLYPVSYTFFEWML